VYQASVRIGHFGPLPIDRLLAEAQDKSCEDVRDCIYGVLSLGEGCDSFKIDYNDASRGAVLPSVRALPVRMLSVEAKVL
jgi:hypothetical protein